MISTDLLILGFRRIRLNYVVVFIYIPSIEKLVVLISHFSAIRHVWPDIVKLPESFGEFDMCGVVHAGVAEDAHTVLRQLAIP